MERAKWEQPIRGAVLGIVLCLAYVAGRFYSLDQWFLPAGVRVAFFLLLPYRYWPYLLIGDCSAMLLLRVPRIPVDNATWAYSGAVLMPLLSCLAIAGLRGKLKSLAQQTKWLPLIAAYMALWSAASTVAINNVFGGPPDGITLEFFYVRCVGHFLAITAITSFGMLWLSRHDETERPPHFLRDTLFFGVVLGAIFCLIILPKQVGEHLRIGLMQTMLFPIAFLTLRHGWRGAAIGISTTCFAFARTLYYLNIEGAHDAPLFTVQHSLVMASFGLLALGHVISYHYASARTLGIAKSEALHSSRTSFLVSEPMLREKALTMEQLNFRMDSERKRVAEYLKSIGDYEGALRLNNEAVEHNARFGAYITEIYPLGLERHGLNAVLNSTEFSDARGNGAHVLPLLGSNAADLSFELQLVAFRCAGLTLDVLSELEPRAYVVKTRVHIGARQRGIAIFATVRDPTRLQSTPKSARAAIELSARVKAHGGIVKRRHAHHIRVWLSELKEPSGTSQRAASG